MKEHRWIQVAALLSGYIHFADLIPWADSLILQLESPPLWLLDLSTAKTDSDAVDALMSAQLDWSDRSDYDTLYLGLLYLRFERGDLTMADLLTFAGEYSDVHECMSCESFYRLLNEIDGGGPTIPSVEPLEKRVFKVFKPKIDFALEHLSDLPTHEETSGDQWSIPRSLL